MSGGTGTNGPVTSAGVILYGIRTGAPSRFSSAHVGSSTAPEAFNPFAAWNAAIAFFRFDPNPASISPGENRARSSSTCARNTAAPLDFGPTRSMRFGSLTRSGVIALGAEAEAQFAAGMIIMPAQAITIVNSFDFNL